MSYVITLNPGVKSGEAAKKAATYIIDRWMPNNRGGVHVLVTPRLTAQLFKFWELVNQFDRPAKIRVIIEGNMPVLHVLEETYQ